MKKFFFTLLCLLTMTISFGQKNNYSVGLDTVPSNQTVNVKVSNTPNITVMDKTFMETISDYKFQQSQLSNELYKLESKVDKIENKPTLTLNEILVRNKGFTDEQVISSINKNRFIWFFTIIIWSILYLYSLNPLLKEHVLDDNKKPFVRISLLLVSLAIMPVILYTLYYSATALLNPDYLAIKELLNLFG